MNTQEKKSQNENKINNLERIKEKKDDTNAVENKIIHELELQLSKNKKEINDIKLRKLAHIENIKKNTEKTIEKIKNEKIEEFLKKIVPIIDTLEEILKLSDKSILKDQSLVQGIELTLKSLLNILNKLNVKFIGQKNELFNSNIHDAISVQPSKETAPNHIITVHKKGMIFGQLLLRKSIVTISKN